MHNTDHRGAYAPNLTTAVLAAPASAAGLAALGSPGAAPACLSPPHKDESHRLAGAVGFRDQFKADASIVADLDGQRKAFLTLQARFALAGWVLSCDGTNDDVGPFLASRWGRSVELATIAAIAAFASQVGAP